MEMDQCRYDKHIHIIQRNTLVRIIDVIIMARNPINVGAIAFFLVFTGLTALWLLQGKNLLGITATTYLFIFGVVFLALASKRGLGKLVNSKVEADDWIIGAEIVGGLASIAVGLGLVVGYNIPVINRIAGTFILVLFLVILMKFIRHLLTGK